MDERKRKGEKTMFKRIKKWFCKKQRTKRVSGLSKGLEVVDNLMVPGLNNRYDKLRKKAWYAQLYT